MKLAALLDEAEERALAVVTEKNPELPEETAEANRAGRRHRRGQVRRSLAEPDDRLRVQLAEDAGHDRQHRALHAIRLRPRPKHFPQSGWELQERPSGRNREDRGAEAAPTLLVAHPAELDLAKHLLRFSETLQAVLDDDKPNWLTSYLYDLSAKFSTFYENCPVLQSDEPVRSSRLTLCRLTADVIKRGLSLLGIDVIEQM